MDRKFFIGAGLLVLASITIGLVVADGSADFGTEKAAIIQLDGQIKPSSSSFGSQGVTPSTVRDLNDQAIEQGASAIIYEWNSGGGAVVASKEIRREIESVEVPTVCRFRDIAASGAYLAATGCDRIVADPASLTGSIGVKGSYLEFSGLMNKLGIEYVNITSGELKSVGSPFKNATPRERKVLKKIADRTHRQFVQSVEEDRNLSERQVKEIKSGSIYLGSRAKELGLVDTLGGRATALNEAENLTESELETFNVESRQKLGLLSLLSADSWLKNSINTGSPIEAAWR